MSADRLTLRWVRWYTRGLPPAARDDRRAEIESDLWEHRAAADEGLGAELAILSRAARGVPADLSWRRARRRGRRLPAPRTVAKGLGWAFATCSYLFAIANLGFAATAVVGADLYGDDWAPGDVTFYSRVCAALFAAFVVGAASIRRYPRAGAMAVVAACVATPLVFWWTAPMTVPMAMAIAIAAVTLARRRRRASRMTGRHECRPYGPDSSGPSRR